MNVYTTYHRIRSVKADVGYTAGSPLTITLTDHEGNRAEIVSFTDDPALSERLARAINEAAAEPALAEDAA